MSRFAQWGVVAVASAAMTLVGCSGNTAYPILDRPQEDSDVVPDSVLDVLDLSSVNLGSSRLSATDDGVKYFLLEETEAVNGIVSACLLVAGPSPVLGCGGNGFVELSGGMPNDAQLVPAPASDGDGWTAISDNVRVRAKNG